MLFLFVYSLREFSRFLEKAVSIVALGNSLKSDGRMSNRNYSRTSAVKKQNSSLTVSTETQTSSGTAVKLFFKMSYAVQIKTFSVHFFGKIQNRIFDPRSPGSWCVKGTDESLPRVYSSLPLMHHMHDPSDLGSKIWIWIFQKKHTLTF